MQVVRFSGSRIAACLLIALVVMAALGASTADARPAGRGSRDGVSGCRGCRDGVSGCRGCPRDPAVMLSNGLVVQMTAVIGAPLSEIEGIHYSLRTPAGTPVERVIYSGGHRHATETLLFYTDAPAGLYSTEMVN